MFRAQTFRFDITRLLPCVLLAAVLLIASATATAQSIVSLDRISPVPGQKQMHTLRDMRFLDLMQQRYDFSCGTAALATLLHHGYGYDDISEVELIKQMMQGVDPQQVIAKGFSMLDMKRYVEGRGLRGFGFRIDAEALYRLKMPVIALMDINGYKHFVVVKGAEAGRVFIADPALGHRVVFEDAFEDGWNGIVFAVIADRPLRRDSHLVNSRTSPALRGRMDALERATTPTPPVEFGLAPVDLF